MDLSFARTLLGAIQAVSQLPVNIQADTFFVPSIQASSAQRALACVKYDGSSYSRIKQCLTMLITLAPALITVEAPNCTNRQLACSAQSAQPRHASHPRKTRQPPPAWFAPLLPWLLLDCLPCVAVLVLCCVLLCFALLSIRNDGPLRCPCLCCL